MTTNWSEIFGPEWEWIQKLGASMKDPEEKKAFWEAVKQKKTDDPSYSIYSDFPREEIPLNSNKAMALHYCGQILEMLKGHSKKDNERQGA